MNQTVKIATTVALVSNRNPANAGQTVTFTASVSPGAATGQVQFFDGASLLATVQLSGAQAAYSTKNLAKRTHTIQAVYGGSATHAGSAASLTQTIR